MGTLSPAAGEGKVAHSLCGSANGDWAPTVCWCWGGSEDA